MAPSPAADALRNKSYKVKAESGQQKILNDLSYLFRMPLNPQTVLRSAASALFKTHFEAGVEPNTVYAPGRVNLVGEHIDYHNLPCSLWP